MLTCIYYAFSAKIAFPLKDLCINNKIMFFYSVISALIDALLVVLILFSLLFIFIIFFVNKVKRNIHSKTNNLELTVLIKKSKTYYKFPSLVVVIPVFITFCVIVVNVFAVSSIFIYLRYISDPCNKINMGYDSIGPDGYHYNYNKKYLECISSDVARVFQLKCGPNVSIAFVLCGFIVQVLQLNIYSLLAAFCNSKYKNWIEFKS